MPAPTSHHLTANSPKLHYLQAGGGNPVLLFHGFPTSSHLYRNILPELGNTHRAIALDLPGYGLSDKPLDVAYDYDFYADTLCGFLDALDIGCTHLVVHGLGVGGLAEIAKKLPNLEALLRLVYGENDRVLPDVAKTMKRIKELSPDAELTALPNCGHFLQEDEPEKVAQLIAEFVRLEGP